MWGRDFELNKGGALPDIERMACLEEELKAAKRQAKSPADQLLGSIAILSLPLPRGGILTVMAKRYIPESRTGDLDLDGMPRPPVAVFGLRAWDTTSIDRLRGTYGGYAALRREGMAKGQPCEGYAWQR